MQLKDRIIVALDVETLKRLPGIIDALKPWGIDQFMVGPDILESITWVQAVRAIKGLGGQAICRATEQQIAFEQQMMAAIDAGAASVIIGAWHPERLKRLARYGAGRVLAKPMLTALGEQAAREFYGTNLAAALVEQAFIAADAGCAGFACDAWELAKLPRKEFEGMARVALDVVPTWYDADSAITPMKAMDAGATMVAVGRPLTAPVDGDINKAGHLLLRDVREAILAPVLARPTDLGYRLQQS
jgi:orotidine-5'-phosphate decarboxylase